MLAIDDIIYTKEITNNKLNNTPSEQELKNIKELIAKILRPLEKKWDDYCLNNNLGHGGIVIKRGFISKNISDNYIIDSYMNFNSGFSVTTYPSNGNMKEYSSFIKKYFNRKNYDRIIEIGFKNGIPDSIYISYKNITGEQRKQYFSLI